jgi:Flp pilus assembly pilin Flp
MKKRIFSIGLLLTLICCAIVATLSYGQQVTVSDEIAGALNKLGGGNQAQRIEAFYRLIEIGNNGAVGGDTSMIPTALSKLAAKAPERADAVKLGLIKLLEKENAFIKQSEQKYRATGETLSEDYLSYHGD